MQIILIIIIIMGRPVPSAGIASPPSFLLSSLPDKAHLPPLPQQNTRYIKKREHTGSRAYPC